MKTIRIVTLGCSKNTVDSEHFLAQLPPESFSLVPDGPADAMLINTCGFIGDAKEESIAAILEAVELKKRGTIGELIVFGCLSQRYRNELPGEIPEVDAWYGARDVGELLRHFGLPAGPMTARRRMSRQPFAWLKISEGCDRRCSYCAIPMIRGAHRSVPMEEIMTEARALVDDGVKELILIAQDTACYGVDLYKKKMLAPLVQQLSEIDGLERIRIHYTYPDEFPEDLLPELRDNRKLCRYLDLPLQHIADPVLRKMHRTISGKGIRELLARLRSEVPGLVLRTTIMVGHPGEGEAEFKELMDFVREAKIERLGAFMYSEEEGTYGAEHFRDEVSPEEKQRRFDELMSLQREVSAACNEARVGTETEVLVDERLDGDVLLCRSEYESPEVDGEILLRDPEHKFAPGDFVRVRITEAQDYDLVAEVM